MDSYWGCETSKTDGARLVPGTTCSLPLSVQPALRLAIRMAVLELPGRGAVTSLKFVTAAGLGLQEVCVWQGWRVRRKLPSVEKPSRYQTEACEVRELSPLFK